MNAMKLHLLYPGRLLAPAGVVILLMSMGATSAFAHAQLVKSFPANKAEVTASPGHVDLWFNELLDDGFNSIEVIPAAEAAAKTHANLATGEPKVDPADHTHLTINVSLLKPGKYVVQYRVLSRDGHSAPGRVNFRVVAPPA